MNENIAVALIGTIVPALSAVLTFLTLRRVGVVDQKVEQVEVNTNHKMDLMLEAVRGRANAEGRAAGREAEREEHVDDERRKREETA